MEKIILEIIKNQSVQILLLLSGIIFIILGIAGHIKDWIDIRDSNVKQFLFTVFGVLFLILGLAPFSISDSESKTKKTSIPPLSFNVQWLSSGENVIFRNRPNYDRDKGVDLFKQGKYAEAANFFERAIYDDSNDPEVRIYFNNAQIRQKTSDLTVLASVVPVDNGQNNAEAFLRGVVDGQTSCNKKSRHLIEIKIANDADQPERAQIIAENLSDSEEVVGIIGHLSSSTTAQGLKKYEKKKVPVISPTSTSDLLDSEVFFRTTPSDRANGSELAKYAIRKLKTKSQPRAVGFYNPDDLYSKSLWTAFQSEFKKLGGDAVPYDVSLKDSSFEPEKAVDDLRDNVDVIALFPNTLLISKAVGVAKAFSSENLNSSPLMVGGDTLYDRQVLISGSSSVEGLVLSVAWHPTDRNYGVKKTEWKGQLNWISAMSYDATQAFCEAIAQTNSRPNRFDILENLKIISLFSSNTSGDPLSFDESGEVVRTPVLVQVSKTNSVQGTPYGFERIN